MLPMTKEPVESIPLAENEDGVILVGGTRVTLETVVGSFQEGATPEEIVFQYPSLSLADVYAVVSYYLRHRAAVDAYMVQREAQSNRVRQEKPMPGVFEVSTKVPIATAIDDLILLAELSLDGEWEGQVRYLPLR